MPGAAQPPRTRGIILAVLAAAVTLAFSSGCQPAPTPQPTGDARSPQLTDPLTKPVQALIDFKNDSVYKLQVKPAVKLFQATEGRYPKDLEEFQQKIIAANNIKLPELPAGQELAYDPQTGELSVVASSGDASSP